MAGWVPVAEPKRFRAARPLLAGRVVGPGLAVLVVATVRVLTSVGVLVTVLVPLVVLVPTVVWTRVDRTVLASVAVRAVPVRRAVTIRWAISVTPITAWRAIPSAGLGSWRRGTMSRVASW